MIIGAAIGAVVEWVAANGTAIAVAATAASAAAGAYEARVSGIEASKQATREARAANLQAQQQQIDARRKALAGMARQNAQAGIGGIGTGGGTSYGANEKRQINEEQNDLLANRAGASAVVAGYNAQGQNASDTGSLTALMDAMKGAGSAAKLAPGKSPSIAPDYSGQGANGGQPVDPTQLGL